MPMNPAFVQLILGLQNLNLSRREQDLNEQKFAEQQSQFKELVRQFEHTHDDTDAAKGLELLAKASPDQFTGMQKLLQSTTFKNNPDALEALMQVAVASPSAKGFASMLPQQRQGLNQEAAALTATGGQMGTGAAGQSQMLGAFAGMNPQPQGTQQAVPPDSFTAMIQNYAQRNAAGYTPDQLAIQQFQAATGRNAVEADMARIMAMAKQNQLEAIFKAQASPSDVVSVMKGLGDLLNDMKNPKSSKEDNNARQQLYNQGIAFLRNNGYLGTGMFNVPGANQLMQGVGNPNSTFTRMLQGFTMLPGTPLGNQFRPDSLPR